MSIFSAMSTGVSGLAGQSKKFQTISDNVSNIGARAVSLRIPSPVGPGLRARRIFSTFVEAASRGEPLRVAEPARAQDYVDVRDVADAIRASLDARGNGVFNIASGRAVTNEALARRLAKERGIPLDEAYRQMREAVGVRGVAGTRPGGQPEYRREGLFFS